MARYDKLQQLIDLQKVTCRVLHIERELSGLPERRLDLQQRFVQGYDVLEQARASLDEFRRELKRDEQQLQDAEGKLSDKREQQTSVRTNAEYTAVRKELTFLEESKGEIEERILRWMEEISEREKALGDLEAGAESAREEYEREIPPLEERIEELEAQLREVAAEAEAIRGSLDARWLSMFDRLSSTKRGVAVVPIDGATCGGCHAALPLAVVEAVRYGQEIVSCDSCMRILYYPDESDD